MRVDRTGAVEIAELASQFDWSWTQSDIPELITLMGWGQPKPSKSEVGVLDSSTGLDVDQPIVRFSGSDGRLDHIIVTVGTVSADPGVEDRDVRSDLAAAFHQVSIGLWGLWGAATGIKVSTKAGLCWTFPTLGVGLAVGATTIELWLIAPAEQRRVAELERGQAATFEASGTWIDYAAAISVLVQADPGAWSDADLNQVFAQLGWTVSAESGPSGTLRADAGQVSLSAARSTEYQRRRGYGDYASLRLRTILPSTVVDIAYAAALAACARSLGPPSFVSGPGAIVTWRRHDTTLMLSRDLSRGSGALVVELSPTAAMENEIAFYSEWSEDGVPGEYWRVRPDRTAERTDLEGMWFPGTRDADDWDTFNSNLGEVFISLGEDLRVLGPYAPSITWVITADGADGFIAQGWFSPTGSRVETLEGGEIVFRDYPPGRDGAEQILRITRAALRTAVDAPHSLRYYAFAQAPQQLWDFRLGIAESRDEQ
ncbi:DUF6301 family protein [Nocardia suismassiliense]|uniref:DUF6301 family protein n=1 Tax=Nocardia suismassiliense TaxID=2077092 RepID=UPI00131EEFB7|nr:DUF6301 family protein [Nocardia suismassiliense]